ncbi:Hypothetical predicted protein [Paramuricea clavata]|uniref:Uncharacterized protein n=1 Tax=Paramuricea clavata TaxID=317549 RepID=A0A6S7JHR5_PARCT|nr:Hypothetical predicted protein [Paramuricea clavata]
MSFPRLSFSNALKLGIIFLIIKQLKADDEQFGDIQMLFRQVDKGYRLTGSILSEFKVFSLLDCALQCLQYTYEICVGFNYKSVIKTNEAKCQLAVKQPDDAMDMAAEDWTFYQVEVTSINECMSCKSAPLNEHIILTANARNLL